MFHLGPTREEQLVQENGTVAATHLRFDRRTSQVAYETATFGMG